MIHGYVYTMSLIVPFEKARGFALQVTPISQVFHVLFIQYLLISSFFGVDHILKHYALFSWNSQ